MAKVPDALSLAAMVRVSAMLGRRVGGSTGTNFVGALFVAQRMKREGRRGSIVALLCDGGERYAHSYYNPRWYIANAIDRHQADVAIASAVGGGPLPDLSTTERSPSARSN
jgi:cysteine synthase A